MDFTNKQQYDKEYKKELYNTRKLNGCCQQCGKPMVDNSLDNKTVRCDVCRTSCNEYGRVKNKERYNAKNGTAGRFLSRKNISAIELDNYMNVGLF